MLEKSIEKKLKDRIEDQIDGAKCLKFVSPGYSGVPDRIILLPGGRVVFVETKQLGKVERQRQMFVQSRLRKLGFPVFSKVDNDDKVNEVVRVCVGYHARYKTYLAAKVLKQGGDDL